MKKPAGQTKVALKVAVLISTLLVLTGCFEITQVLSWGANDTLDVHWIFRYPTSIEKTGASQGAGNDLASQIEDTKKNINDTLGSQVKNLSIKKTETEYDVSQEMSFTVPRYSRLNFGKLEGQDFPFVPVYNAAQKEVVFTFKAVKTEKPADADDAEAPDATEEADAPPADATTDDSSGQGMDVMGRQIAKMMLSSVRYQIILGGRMDPRRVIIRKGDKETVIKPVTLDSMIMIDIPLYAVYGEDGEAFSVVVMLK
ncbi:MAG: hypothetical protein JXD23_08760 [Spirochaetales bacterium]|nr:hypothetical protein [Spirochaetales bacterium]